MSRSDSLSSTWFIAKVPECLFALLNFLFLRSLLGSFTESPSLCWLSLSYHFPQLFICNLSEVTDHFKKNQSFEFFVWHFTYFSVFEFSYWGMKSIWSSQVALFSIFRVEFSHPLAWSFFSFTWGSSVWPSPEGCVPIATERVSKHS